MPAAPSSPIGPAVGQLLAAARALGREGKGVLPLLAAFPDPRARRGVRHPVAVVLGLAVCAVLAGARSFVAIAEWAADADQATLDGLGVTGVVPCESTFRRVLQSLDADALDDAAGAWAQQRTAPVPGGRRLIAVNGKTLRGSAAAGQPGRHLLAALDHDRGVVLGQVDVQAKTNEIPMFAMLLDRIDLAGAVVTADALHAQSGHAQYLAGLRRAHYLITVKRNQPSLHAQLAGLPWRQIPAADIQHDQRARPGRAALPESHRRSRRYCLPARRPGHPGRAPPASAERQEQKEMVRPDRIRGHLADGNPGQPGPARRHPARPLVNRGQSALGTRCHLRRGSIADPHPQRPPGHGQPPQPRHHDPAPDRPRKHRSRTALLRQAPHPATPNDHALLTAKGLCRCPGSPAAAASARRGLGVLLWAGVIYLSSFPNKVMLQALSRRCHTGSDEN